MNDTASVEKKNLLKIICGGGKRRAYVKEN